MDKLQYDNLYKFLVSLGIVLIVLPVAALVFLFNMEPKKGEMILTKKKLF